MLYDIQRDLFLTLIAAVAGLADIQTNGRPIKHIASTAQRMVAQAKGRANIKEKTRQDEFEDEIEDELEVEFVVEDRQKQRPIALATTL